MNIILVFICWAVIALTAANCQIDSNTRTTVFNNTQYAGKAMTTDSTSVMFNYGDDDDIIVFYNNSSNSHIFHSTRYATFSKVEEVDFYVVDSLTHVELSAINTILLGKPHDSHPVIIHYVLNKENEVVVFNMVRATKDKCTGTISKDGGITLRNIDQ